MSISTAAADERRYLASRVTRGYRRERRRPFMHTRFIPQLMKEFFCDECTFLERFGINPYEFEELHKMVEGKIRRHHTSFRDNIGSRERLAIVLRFLASGDSYQVLSTNYNIPENTIPTMIREVSRTVSRYLMPIVMPRPNKKMWERNAADFKKMFDMPNCIGAIEGKKLLVDGKRVALLALVDAKDRFIMIDVGPCQLHYYRGNIMDRSNMGKCFMRKEMGVPDDKPITADSDPVPFVMLGSSFFPPKPYLMTKYSKPECATNETHKVFNTRVSRAKVTVNRALMSLRNRWRLFQGPLPVPLPLAEQIVLTCCCLHNYFTLRTPQPVLPNYPDSVVAITPERLDSLLEQLPERPNNVRDQFKAYFMSPEGQVPWQWQEVVQAEEDSSDDGDDEHDE